MQKQCFNTVSNLHTYNMYLESTLQQVAVHSDLVQRFQAGENIQSRLQYASILELQTIAEIIRHRILEVVSKNGGHLSSTLGAVELIIGMHTVFNCRENPFIYDVSHQAYAHKLLTGRYNDFDSLRQFNGISGFVAPYESEYDYFIAGHSSTSLSLAVGVAKAKKLKNLYSTSSNTNNFIFMTDKTKIRYDIGIDDRVSNLKNCDKKLLFTEFRNKELTNEELEEKA